MKSFLLHTTPLARIMVASENGALTHVQILTGALFGYPAGWEPGDPEGLLAEATRQLDAYFTGSLRSFTLPLSPVGTPFQKRVWSALQQIPCGKTISYAELADQVGSGARAVGGANGANPLGIVIPCHRVVTSDGGLGGYAGGVEQKRWLLRHEGALTAPLFRSPTCLNAPKLS